MYSIECECVWLSTFCTLIFADCFPAIFDRWLTYSVQCCLFEIGFGCLTFSVPVRWSVANFFSLLLHCHWLDLLTVFPWINAAPNSTWFLDADFRSTANLMLMIWCARSDIPGRCECSMFCVRAVPYCLCKVFWTCFVWFRDLIVWMFWTCSDVFLWLWLYECGMSYFARCLCGWMFYVVWKIVCIFVATPLRRAWRRLFRVNLIGVKIAHWFTLAVDQWINVGRACNLF